jgi:hypothetical protein
MMRLKKWPLSKQSQDELRQVARKASALQKYSKVKRHILSTQSTTQGHKTNSAT